MSVRVETSPEVVDVFVSGFDRVVGFRSRIELPISRVEDARVLPKSQASRDVWLRTGGLGLPYLATVGYFRGVAAKKQWWRVYRAKQVLVISMKDASEFGRIVLEIDDPGAVAKEINDAVEAAA